MREELEKKLVEKYPKIFAQKDLPPNQSLMCFGIECGDGWFNLLDALCECIQSYVDEGNYHQVEATQIKEKYGTLRFYISGGDDYIWDVVEKAEVESGKICEQCGAPGALRGSSWLFTMCDLCWDKKEH